MTTIVTRAGKGSPLTNTEMDTNLTNLNTDKIEAASNNTLTNKSIALGSNTISGTKAEFNAALTDADFATLAGTEALTNKTITDPTNTVYANAGPSNSPFSHRNKIINGDCRIAQRGSVTLVNSSLQYGGADRFITNCSATTATGTIVQATGVGVSGFAVGATGVTTTGVTSGALMQRIESEDVRSLNSKTVTVQCKILHDFGAAQTFSLALYKANALNNFGGVTLIATTSLSIANNTITTMTLTASLGASDATNGLAVILSFSSGALTNKSYYWTDVQLEEGAVATPFEVRPIETELALCQRYFFKTFPQGTAPAQNAGTSGAFSYSVGIAGANPWGVFFPFPVTMRIAPTVTTYNPGNTNANWRNSSAGVDSGANTVLFSADSNLTLRNAQVAGDAISQTCTIHLTASAEL